MPLSFSATRDLLTSLGHQPKRFLGQNFLVDGNIVRKSLDLADVRFGDTVVEVGPGLGTLTNALLTAGADVWAVEKDRSLHAHLESTLLNPAVYPEFAARFHLLEGDAVEFPLAALPAERAIAGFKIVANLPYAIATPWLDGVLSGPLPTRMVLMLQQEAAQRYAAQPGTKSFGAISVFLQAAYDLAPGHKVGPGCFHPRPDVDSYLINLVRRDAPFVFTPAVKAIVRACFQQRRKQIGALLRTHAPAYAAEARELLLAEGLTEQARPEAIPVSWWRRFAALPALA
jgi:16S rRNA (adenine1518-N6/adenine1519-N6)-dimethyltransferase